MPKRMLVLALLLLLLAGCGPAPLPSALPPTALPDAPTTVPPTALPVVISPLPTAPAPATATARIQVTPTARPTAALRVSLTPTVAYAPLSDLPEGRRIGRGRVTTMAWTQEGRLLVGTTMGVYVYAESQTPEAFLETPAPVTRLILSPRGDLLAAVGPRGRWLWETKMWQPLDVPLGRGGGLAFSSDGNLLAAGTRTAEGDEVRIWDVRTWTEVQTLAGASYVAFSPDDALLAAGTCTAEGGQVRVWNVETWMEAEGLPGGCYASFSPDGAALVTESHTAAGGQVRVWDVGTWTEARVITLTDDYYVAFSPSGDRLALASPTEYAWGVAVWDIGTWQEVWHADTDCGSLWGCGVMDLAYTPDGAWLALASTVGDIWMWDAATGQAGHSALAESDLRGPVAFSSAAPLLAGRTGDAQVALWRLDQEQRVAVLGGYGGPVDSVALSPDGTLLANDGFGNGVRVVEATAGRILWEVHGHEYLFDSGVSSLAFSPDGTVLAAGMMWLDDTGTWGEVRLWEADTGKPVRTIPVPPLGEWQDGGVYSLAFSPDGALLAAGCDADTVRFWDTATGEVVRIITATGGAGSVAFSPDGRLLAGGDGDVRIWEVATGRQLQAIAAHGYTVHQLAFSPSGAILVAADTLHLYAWDVETGREVWRSGDPPYTLYSLALAPDGTVLAVGQADGTIWLWDTGSWQEVGTVRAHKDAVRALVFSPDGALLVSGSADGTVGLWAIER